VFCGRVIAVVLVWLGVAVLDQGARSSAAFMTSITTEPNAVEQSGGAGPVLDCGLSRLPSDVPAYRFLHAFDRGFQDVPGGGAGSSSNTNSTGFGSSVALDGSFDCGLGPKLAVLLRTREALLISTPLTAAIFEPPRRNC
jgi:hypothetical protein